MKLNLQPAKKRLAVFHRYCELAPHAQTVVSELVFWLHERDPRTEKELLSALEALRRCNTVRQQIAR